MTAEDCICGQGDLAPWLHLQPCPSFGPVPLPTLSGMVGDVAHLLAQALTILGRELDPASLPGGSPDRSEYYRKAAALHIAAAQRELGRLRAWIPKPTPAKGEEPTPGSAVVLRGATSESQSPVAAGAEAGNTPDLPPGSGAPAALPVREVGLSLSELYKRHNSTGWPR
jgi:hypothetical protein